MSNHICDNTKLIIQVTGHGHDNPKKQPQQLMFYKDDYKTPQQNIKSQEGITKLQEDNYPSRYECPSILFEYPECDAKDTQLAIKVSKQNGGDIILPVLDKVVGGTTDKDNTQVYKSHRISAIVPMTYILPITPQTVIDLDEINDNTTELPYKYAKPLCVLARKGYFYVFVNDKLWRELQIVQDKQGKTTYQDIDLKSYQDKKEYRQATGAPLNDIWIPATFPGQAIKVQVAYSEEQWPLERIQYLEKNSKILNTRCTTIEANAKLNNFNENQKKGQLFKLQNLPEHRPRNFEEEIMQDNPHSYLNNLGVNYLANVVVANQIGYAKCKTQSSYATLDVDEFAIPKACRDRFETGTWLKMFYEQDPTNYKELKDAAEFWPEPSEPYDPNKKGVIPAILDLNYPSQKVVGALDDLKKRYITGVIIQDPLYQLHYLQRCISTSLILLKFIVQVAQKRPWNYLAVVVNSQRRYFTSINDSLKNVGKPVQQNFGYAICEIERLAIVAFAERCQATLLITLKKPQTHEALADLLSNHNPIDYAGHILFTLNSLQSLAYPARNHDDLSHTTFAERSEGQRFIQSINQGMQERLKQLIETKKAEDILLKELEDYFVSSTEPTDNVGDGEFRLAVLKTLNDQLKTQSYAKPTSYNGKVFEDTAKTLDDPNIIQESLEEKVSASVESTSITISKGVSSTLASVSLLMPKLYGIADEAAKREQRINQQIAANEKTMRTIDSTTKVNTAAEGLEKTQNIHAKAIYNLREIAPDIFKDMAFIPLDKIEADVRFKGGYLVGVNDIADNIFNTLESQYSSKVRLIQLKKGSNIEQMWQAFALYDSNAYPRSYFGADGFNKAAEQAWQEHLTRAGYKPTNTPGEATKLLESRTAFIDSHIDEITHRAFLNAVEDSIKKGEVLDFGTGSLKEMFDQNVNTKIGEVNDTIGNKTQVELDQNRKAAAAAHETASGINADGARTVEKILNSRIAGGAFLAFEIWNVKAFAAGVDELRAVRGDTRAKIGFASVGIDTLNASLSLMERLSTLNSQQWLTKALDKPRLLLLNYSSRAVLSTAGLLLTAGLCLSDAYYEMAEGHFDRAFYNTAMAAGVSVIFFSGKMAATSVVLGLTPAGWLILGIGLVVASAVALAYFQPSDMEDWLKQGPFADFDALFISAKNYLQDAQEAYYRFLGLIAGIRVTLEKNDQYQKSVINATDTDRKIQQSPYKVTLTSNIPGLINTLKPTEKNGQNPNTTTAKELTDESTQLILEGEYSYITTYRPYTQVKKIIPVTVNHQETTPTGKVMYVGYDRSMVRPTSRFRINAWVQIGVELNYFGLIEKRYFPAPVPSKEQGWDEKYLTPDKTASSPPFWYSVSLEDIG